MGIVGGLDVHRAQITFDYLDTETGEVTAGRVVPATREVFREWLGRFDGREAAFATEGCTGWRFVVEELCRAGVEAHLAEPADTATLRGRKRRAKTDRADARLLRTLLAEGRLPESWVAPSHVLETRVKGRLYVSLMDQRRAWSQRIHAQLFHQGVEKRRNLLAPDQRDWLGGVDLSAAGAQLVAVGLRVTDALDAEIGPLRAELAALSRSLPGPRALREGIWGIGPLTAPIIWAEMGDARRFSSSDQAVRHTGLDVTVWDSDGKRSPGHLSRQGPPALRWALFEAAFLAARRSSPDHDYYLSVKERLGPNRAALSVARKLARRVYHTLRETGEAAWEQTSGQEPA
jgi:transposase